MNRAKQYQLTDDKLILHVKKAPTFVRSTLFFFSSLFFILPVTGMFLYMLSGKGFHVGFLVGFIFFGILGFYLLRNALWNSFGKEIILFHEKGIDYIADYGWFRDGKIQKEILHPRHFRIKSAGYEEDRLGTLMIGSPESNIVCVTKIPIEELEELMDLLKPRSTYT